MRFIYLLLVCVLVGCTFKTKHRGFVFPDDFETKISNIKTIDKLKKDFGDPQVSTVFGNKIYIYYSVDENYRGPFPIKYNNKKALLVWAKGNKITQTKILNNDDFKNVQIKSGETKIPQEIKLNAIEELFNNIGRFKPAGA